MTTKHTFVPTYETEKVSISKHEYSEDSPKNGDTFVALSSGGLTVHYENVSIEYSDNLVDIMWLKSHGHIIEMIFVDREDSTQIEDIFGD